MAFAVEAKLRPLHSPGATTLPEIGHQIEGFCPGHYRVKEQRRQNDVAIFAFPGKFGHNVAEWNEGSYPGFLDLSSLGFTTHRGDGNGHQFIVTKPILLDVIPD